MSAESSPNNSGRFPEERDALSEAVAWGADPNLILFHKRHAGVNAIPGRIPMIEQQITEDDTGIVIGEDKEYVIPQTQSPEEDRDLELLRHATLTTSELLAETLSEDPSIIPQKKYTTGTYQYKSQCQSPWGKLTVLFNEEPDSKRDNVVVSTSEIFPDEFGDPTPTITFHAVIFLNNSLIIREHHSESPPTTLRLFGNEKDFVDNNCFSLLDKTISIMNFYTNNEYRLGEEHIQ